MDTRIFALNSPKLQKDGLLSASHCMMVGDRAVFRKSAEFTVEGGFGQNIGVGLTCNVIGHPFAGAACYRFPQHPTHL